MKGTLWRAIYFYCFLLFTGFLGYVNQYSVGKILGKRSPFEAFTSYVSLLIFSSSLRSLLFFCSIVLLNVLWLVNCFRYDLRQVSLLSQPLKFLSKTVCLWLDLLWSLSLLLCTRNTIMQYILQSPFVPFLSFPSHSQTFSIAIHKQIGTFTLFMVAFLSVVSIADASPRVPHSPPLVPFLH